jgi:hypothetical protein
LLQRLHQIIVSGNGFLGTFRLADANNVLNDGAGDVDLFRLGIDVLPFQCENLTSSQAGGYGKQDERVLSEAEIRQQPRYFMGRKDVRRCPFCALTDPLNRVSFAKVIATSMIEEQTHDIPYLAA